MGRTNDAIIYGGRVYLCIDDDDDEIKKLAKNLPSLIQKTMENLLNKFSWIMKKIFIKLMDLYSVQQQFY